MKLKELLDTSLDIDISGITERASDVQPGDVFCAIKGTKVNGADFIDSAIEKGAVAILTDQEITTTVPVVKCENPRTILTQICAKLYPSEQLKKVAVTGTNGKTSTVYYTAQIMNALGVLSASMGTIGIDSPVYKQDGKMTMPDGVRLNKSFHDLQEKGIQVVAMEASSHGLDQGRLDGHKVQAAAFTNLTRDHLDYHQTMENYLNAKMRLFSDYIVENGMAVLNADVPEYDVLKQVCLQKKLNIISYGKNAETLKLVQQKPMQDGQILTIEVDGKTYEIPLKIYGDFQAYNILAATGLCMGLGKTWTEIAAILPSLVSPPGRLEPIGEINGAQIFVDYAHTPDALERVLNSLRPHTQNKLSCLFGCGGNRDKGKRPQMGEIADRLADVVYITDDNPRDEEPEMIRQEIKQACPKGIEVDSRQQAIQTAIQNLTAGDILVLAGKGHESGQTIKGVEYPFNDKIEVQQILKSLTPNPLWTGKELQLALNNPSVLPELKAYGVVFNSRETKVGDIFIALTTGQTDGHQYVQDALNRGAVVCIVSHEMPNVFAHQQIVVPDTLQALHALARFARMRTQAQVVGITGSCGKTSTKEMLLATLQEQGIAYATAANFNNNLGVPFTLANMPANTQYAIIEMGVSHPGEMTELSDFVRPNVTIVTNIAPAHQEFFPDKRAIAAEKIHILDYQSKDGTIVLNADDEQSQFMADTAVAAGIKKIIRFGQNDQSDFKLLSARVTNDATIVSAQWYEEKLDFALRLIGRHFAINALGVLAVIDALGASVDYAVKTLEKLKPIAGRGQTTDLSINGKTVHIIDDAYNANPASMGAGIAALGARSGQKIAVLGDMLELGDNSYQMHLDILDQLEENGVSKLYAVGPIMSQVFDLAPPHLQGAKAPSAVELADRLRMDLQDGDWVLFKASHGIGLAKLIKELKGE